MSTTASWYAVEAIPSMTIEAFAAQHGLRLVVSERRVNEHSPERFYARFENAEVKDGCILRSDFGNGNTPEQAIADYIPRISLTLLVIDALRGNRREIRVPRLTASP